MPSWIARIALLAALMGALALPVIPQDAPTVTISPTTGPAESAVFDIHISGLDAETDYSVEIVFEGEVVFSSQETSDADGAIAYPISSTEGDAPGIYSVQVLLAGEVVASADFELTAAADAADAAERDLPGDVTIEPATAPFGSVHTITIGDLQPRTDYTLEITANETLQVVYRLGQTSDADGFIEVGVFAEADDSPGLHAIALYDAAGDLIAAGEFTIEAPPKREVSLTLTPEVVAAGGTVNITLAGLAAFDSVTAQITSADDVLIDTVLARASSEGEARLSFTAPDDLADGDYSVVIFVEGERQASAILTVSAALPAVDARLSIEPDSAPIGSQHVITASGLPATADFRLVILDPAGDEEFSAERSADAGGDYSLTISSTDEDELGEYTVELRSVADDTLLARASFEISAVPVDEAPAATSDASPIASITPAAAPLGSAHLITVRGLEAGEIVTFDVVFAGQSVFQSQKTADAEGRAEIELVTSDTDQPGDYTITVLRAAGNQPAVVLTAQPKGQSVITAAAVGDAQTVSGNLTDGRAEVAFSGAADQVVLVTVASDDFDSAAALLDRDGRELAFNDDSRGQKNAMIGPLRLPYSGDYSLEITAEPLMMPRGAEIGDFTVTIEPVALAAIDRAAVVRFTLDADTPARYYALPVQTGDSLTVSIDSDGALDTLLQVVSPAGGEFAFDDDSGPGFDAELSNLVFDRAATYVLVVSTFEGGVSGEGRLSIRQNPVHSLDDGEIIVTLNDKALRDLVVFDVAEDEYLILNLEKLRGDVEDLYVTATIEGMEVMSYSTMGVPDELPLAFVTPMSGRVVVTLEKFGFDDGIALEVSLQRP